MLLRVYPTRYTVGHIENIKSLFKLFIDPSFENIPLVPGPCREYIVRWYYDPEANACAQFWYGGCEGNTNNFETEANCRNTCVYT
uniref:BPTI/Kunitz inhibitor domain-containing protein n=1 Tax=Amphiprion percula TaxID=161767 RepID=A0A3P8TJE7_AMPPE